MLELVEKINEFSAKVTISNIKQDKDVKTTVTQEKIFSLDELNSAKTASETALKSWEDNKIKCDENIAIQTEQVALWDRLINESVKQGVVVKPIEKIE